jgi:NADH-quinone oxidoreductase subunit K
MTPAIPTENFLVLAAVLFCMGIFGVLTRRSALVVFMCVELMLNAANLTFLAFAREHGPVSGTFGHVNAFFVITVAAAEAAIGLAIVIAVYRSRGTVNVDDLSTMKH